MYFIVLYFIALYFIYWIIFYFIVLYFIILYFLYFIVVYFILVYCIVFYCILLYCIFYFVLLYFLFCFIVFYFVLFCFIVLLCCVVFYCVVLYCVLLCCVIQNEHKNTPWFQVVIKSKLTGIFLQNWWLQLHNLIKFHVVSQTLNVPPFVTRKHRCDNLALTRHCAAYPNWSSWQLHWCVPVTHPGLWVVEVHRLCPSRTPKGKSHKRSGPVIRPIAEHMLILSNAANPSVWQVLVEKRADSEMPVRRRPILLKKVIMSLNS